MLKINITKLDTNNVNFFNIIKNLINNNNNENVFINNYIENIIYNIKNFKEKSIAFYLKKIENKIIKNIKDIIIKREDMEKSYKNLDNETKYILELAKNRIEIFHKEQKNNYINNWKILEENGNVLGQKINKIDRIGVYIPGGQAVYPSSVFMNIVPLKISKIENFVVCFPKKKNNDIILSSLLMCEAKKIFSIGGIPAISSMCFGNKLIEKVDKICGPGNIFVTISKKIIYGNVGIDSLAGPSEITIITDKYSDYKRIVFDLFSQSEHDKLSQSILICDNYEFLINIENLIKKNIPFLYRKKILYNSIFNNIILIKTKNLNESFNILNYISPEHLIISLKNNSYEFFKNINNSGSNFIGEETSESFGDYTSGLNHVIPTKKNCRFSSPLGVYSFYKNLNFLKSNNLFLKKISKLTMNFSKKEKLYSHFESLDIRL